MFQAAYPGFKECSTLYFGRDLPAWRPSTDSILLNDRTESWAPSCGASHDLTKRPCGCENIEPGPPMTYHTVFNGQVTRVRWGQP